MKTDQSLWQRIKNVQGGSTKPKKAEGAWLVIYISLFSGLLAFFLLSVMLVELEFSSEKRAYQKLLKQLYQASESYKDIHGLEWLQVENTLNNGVRLSFDPKSIRFSQAQGIEQFESAQAKIHPDFVPYLLQVAGLLQHLKLDKLDASSANLNAQLAEQDNFLTMQIRVAGHTDAQPMAPNAPFRDNVELSSFRAYAVMRYLQTHSFLPQSQFAIAGYGAFKPLVENGNAPENRRIEIFIAPMVKPLSVVDVDEVEQVAPGAPDIQNNAIGPQL